MARFKYVPEKFLECMYIDYVYVYICLCVCVCVCVRVRVSVCV